MFHSSSDYRLTLNKFTCNKNSMNPYDSVSHLIVCECYKLGLIQGVQILSICHKWIIVLESQINKTFLILPFTQPNCPQVEEPSRLGRISNSCHCVWRLLTLLIEDYPLLRGQINQISTQEGLFSRSRCSVRLCRTAKECQHVFKCFQTLYFQNSFKIKCHTPNTINILDLLDLNVRCYIIIIMI